MNFIPMGRPGQGRTGPADPGPSQICRQRSFSNLRNKQLNCYNYVLENVSLIFAIIVAG